MSIPHHSKWDGELPHIRPTEGDRNYYWRLERDSHGVGFCSTEHHELHGDEIKEYRDLLEAMIMNGTDEFSLKGRHAKRTPSGGVTWKVSSTTPPFNPWEMIALMDAAIAYNKEQSGE